jgi:hypothetical protein
MSIYTTSTVDSPEYKRLICGRTDAITTLTDYVAQGYSVALFGEKRIGKSSVLYVLRDIINGEIDKYQTELIDLDLKNAVASLREKANNYKYKAVYLDLLGLDFSDSEVFVKCLYNKFQEYSWLKSKLDVYTSENNNTITRLFEGINRSLNDINDIERVAVLFDEIGTILKLNNSQQVFNNLRSAIQSCPRICFVMAGADAWHKEIKDEIAPVVTNVKPFYLRAAQRFPIETFLINKQLKKSLSASADIDAITKIVLEWTECKPYYVQAVCQAIVEVHAETIPLPKDWQSLVEKKFEDSVEKILKSFYSSDNPDDLSPKILGLLANKPGLTVQEIARRLGNSEKVVWEKIDDLESLDKVRKQGSKYRIVGTIIEKWGQKTIDIQRLVKSPWPERIKWGIACFLFLLAIFTYFYTNPSSRTFVCSFPSGELLVDIPSSLEQGESGTAKVQVKNTSLKKISSINITFTSKNIEYERAGTSLAKFDSIDAAETKFLKFNFSSRLLNSGNTFTSQALIFHKSPDSPSPTQCSFEVSARSLAVKKYWRLISFLLVTLSGFVAKPDLLQLIPNVASGLFKSPSESKS